MSFEKSFEARDPIIHHVVPRLGPQKLFNFLLSNREQYKSKSSLYLGMFLETNKKGRENQLYWMLRMHVFPEEIKLIASQEKLEIWIKLFKDCVYAENIDENYRLLAIGCLVLIYSFLNDETEAERYRHLLIVEQSNVNFGNLATWQVAQLANLASNERTGAAIKAMESLPVLMDAMIQKEFSTVYFSLPFYKTCHYFINQSTLNSHLKMLLDEFFNTHSPKSRALYFNCIKICIDRLGQFEIIPHLGDVIALLTLKKSARDLLFAMAIRMLSKLEVDFLKVEYLKMLLRNINTTEFSEYGSSISFIFKTIKSENKSQYFEVLLDYLKHKKSAVYVNKILDIKLTFAEIVNKKFDYNDTNNIIIIGLLYAACKNNMDNVSALVCVELFDYLLSLACRQLREGVKKMQAIIDLIAPFCSKKSLKINLIDLFFEINSIVQEVEFFDKLVTSSRSALFIWHGIWKQCQEPNGRVLGLNKKQLAVLQYAILPKLLNRHFNKWMDEKFLPFFNSVSSSKVQVSVGFLNIVCEVTKLVFNRVDASTQKYLATQIGLWSKLGNFDSKNNMPFVCAGFELSILDAIRKNDIINIKEKIDELLICLEKDFQFVLARSCFKFILNNLSLIHIKEILLPVLGKIFKDKIVVEFFSTLTSQQLKIIVVPWFNDSVGGFQEKNPILFYQVFSDLAQKVPRQKDQYMMHPTPFYLLIIAFKACLHELQEALSCESVSTFQMGNG
jgi:hypothetical protein